MKIFIHRYTLSPLQSLNALTSSAPREGALLKVDWALGKVGFSDLFPWPEFGDPDLEKLIEDLELGDFRYPLVKKSLWRNSADAWARSRGRSLFQSLIMPESHGLLSMTDDSSKLALLREMGFSVFKMKMSGHLRNDFDVLNSLCHALAPSEKVRLDFNGALSYDDFLKFCDRAHSLVKFVDLIEDPWKAEPNGKDSHNRESKARIPKEIQSKLAGDFYHDLRWPHQVLKTARNFLPEKRPLRKRIISTHSMDHPVGQAFSLWEAARYQKLFPHRKEIHGVSRSQIYKSTDFDWAWNGTGARPIPPRGLGVGFDEILWSLKWEALV